MTLCAAFLPALVPVNIDAVDVYLLPGHGTSLYVSDSVARLPAPPPLHPREAIAAIRINHARTLITIAICVHP